MPWALWIDAGLLASRAACDEDAYRQLHLRVRLRDGRDMIVRRVHTHAVEVQGEPVRVIMGYLLLGQDGAGRTTTLCVEPGMLSSVEWVRLPEAQPFGFSPREDRSPDLFGGAAAPVQAARALRACVLAPSEEDFGEEDVPRAD